MENCNNYWIIKIAQNGYNEPFLANNLFISNGLLHHKVSLNDLEYGILSTELAVKLGDHIDD